MTQHSIDAMLQFDANANEHANVDVSVNGPLLQGVLLPDAYGVSDIDPLNSAPPWIVFILFVKFLSLDNMW